MTEEAIARAIQRRLTEATADHEPTLDRVAEIIFEEMTRLQDLAREDATSDFLVIVTAET